MAMVIVCRLIVSVYGRSDITYSHQVKKWTIITVGTDHLNLTLVYYNLLLSIAYIQASDGHSPLAGSYESFLTTVENWLPSTLINTTSRVSLQQGLWSLPAINSDNVITLGLGGHQLRHCLLTYILTLAINFCLDTKFRVNTAIVFW